MNGYRPETTPRLEVQERHGEIRDNPEAASPDGFVSGFGDLTSLGLKPTSPTSEEKAAANSSPKMRLQVSPTTSEMQQSSSTTQFAEREAALLQRFATAIEPRDRVAAAEEIKLIRPVSEEMVKALTIALDDIAPDVRRATARALGALGSASESALPSLARMLTKEKHLEVRTAAATAILHINPESNQAKDIFKRLLVGGSGTTIRTSHDGAVTANRIWACEQLFAIGDGCNWAEDLLCDLCVYTAATLDASGHSELFEKSLRSLTAVKPTKRSTLSSLKKLRDGKSVKTSNQSLRERVRGLADIAIRTIEMTAETP